MPGVEVIVNVLRQRSADASTPASAVKAVGGLVGEDAGDVGRAQVALALRMATDQVVASVAADEQLSTSNGQLSALMNIAIEMTRINMCGLDTPFVLIEDLLLSRTIGELSTVFDFVEHYISILVESKLLHVQRAKLSLLRLCSALLARLPRSQDMEFRGRVLILLTKCFPIDERSGVNLKGAFNTNNVTVVEQEPPQPPAPNLDFPFYKTFWYAAYPIVAWASLTNR